MEDDIGRHFDEIERRVRPFVEAALAVATKRERLAEAGHQVTANAGVCGLAWGQHMIAEGTQRCLRISLKWHSVTLMSSQF